ncbi:unnamed protein product, partial [Ixodes persulcatus]
MLGQVCAGSRPSTTCSGIRVSDPELVHLLPVGCVDVHRVQGAPILGDRQVVRLDEALRTRLSASHLSGREGLNPRAGVELHSETGGSGCAVVNLQAISLLTDGGNSIHPSQLACDAGAEEAKVRAEASPEAEHALVLPVCHAHCVVSLHIGQAVRDPKRIRPTSGGNVGDVLPLGGEDGDAAVAVAIADKDQARRGQRYVGGLAEVAAAGARHKRLAQHQLSAGAVGREPEHLDDRGTFCHLVKCNIRHPDMVLSINVQSVRHKEPAGGNIKLHLHVLAPAPDDKAGLGVENHDGRLTDRALLVPVHVVLVEGAEDDGSPVENIDKPTAVH